MSVNLLRNHNPNGRHNDMRYGEDDPTLWPQQYTSKFHHLEAIAKRGAWQEISIMWWDPQQEDFEWGNTIMCSLGKLVYSILCLLEEAAYQLAGQCQTYCDTVEVKGETISPLFRQLVETRPSALIDKDITNEQSKQIQVEYSRYISQ
ncbi:hypothetical protein K438DRAFT_1747380 [Mycena galopus ATCC 62051]|nr:hypothetical protein K438DRAFT_1747380 [Mycena galopus ATCC 62051]